MKKILLIITIALLSCSSKQSEKKTVEKPIVEFTAVSIKGMNEESKLIEDKNLEVSEQPIIALYGNRIKSGTEKIAPFINDSILELKKINDTEDGKITGSTYRIKVKKEDMDMYYLLKCEENAKFLYVPVMGDDGMVFDYSIYSTVPN